MVLRKPRFSRWSAICVSLSCLLSACCGTPIRPPDDALEDPADLLDAMRIRLDGLQSGRFRVVTEYYGGELRGANFRIVVLVRQPGDLHIEVLSPFGQSLQTLVSNSVQLSLYDLEQEVFYYGTPSPENIARILPFYLTDVDIVRVLLGGPPLTLMSDDAEAYELEWDGERGSYHLTAPLRTGDGRLELWVRHDEWVIEAAKRLDEDGTLVFELRTGDFEPVGDFIIPMQLRFLLETENEIDMSLEIESAELNVDLPDLLFELEPPRGIERVPLD